MKLLVIPLVALWFASNALAAQSCDELKERIDAKVKGKGVKSFTLEVLPKDAPVATGRVVGTCGGGAQKIVYTRK